MRLTVTLWLGISLSALAQPRDLSCPKGLEAYTHSVYAKVMRDCKGCHGGGPTAPGFAVAPAGTSYFMLRNHASFPEIERSVFVVRAGNGHCGSKACNSESGAEMAKLARQWWEEGEKECDHFGKFVTAELSLPQNLPETGYTRVEWPLGDISHKFQGNRFRLEVQNFAGAYRFRSPRFLGRTRSLKVKDIKVLLNRTFDPVTNAYTFVDKTVSPTAAKFPMLSADAMVVLPDGQDTPDRLSISFEQLDEAAPEQCKALDVFRREVQPLLREGRCYSCHATLSAFPLPKDDAAACRSTRELTLMSDPEFLTSPLFALPLHGKFGHQKSSLVPEEFAEALRAWIAAEQER